MAIQDLGQDTRGWRVLLVPAGPLRVIQVHLEGKFLELVQQANPVMIYVNPSTDADAFDEWQTPPLEGDRVPVGRTRANNQTAQLRMETAVSPVARVDTSWLARTQGDQESDDDELLRAALEAEDRLAPPKASITALSEEDLAYTDGSRANYARRQSAPSTKRKRGQS